MSWEYTGDPEESEKDAVRFIIGDTDASDPLLQDEEIEYTLNNNSMNIRLAAIKCVDAIIAKLSRQVDSTIGPMQVKAEAKWTHYRALRIQLLRESGLTTAAPFASPQATTPGAFRVGMHDF